MSEIMESYEQDLIENIKQCSFKLAGPFDTKQDWKEIRSLLTESEKCIKLIETELVGQPAPLRAGKISKLR